MPYRSSGEPVPLTLITGYLGAGKTTLLNRILTADHGRRIAVVQNEFGEIGIDHDLVLNVEQEIYTMNNGCICCTVREDMIEALENLLGRREAFDRIVVETTGLAEPGPALMAFLAHPDIDESFRVDGVVTLVDARHLPLHIDSAPEARAQIAYADHILLNKIDLATPAGLDEIERTIRGINPTAAIERTSHAAADLDALTDLGGFTLDRIPASLRSGAIGEAAHHHTHHHDSGIASVSIAATGAIDRERFDAWIGALLDERHPDIFRMKGILNDRDAARRLVVQSVHALYNWGFGRTWETEARENRIVFIGRDLDREALTRGFRECLIGP